MRTNYMIAAVIALWISPALAQMEPEEPPAQDAPPETESELILEGPDVADHGLVRFDFTGQFIRITGRPEEAALGLLDLDPERAAAARQAGSDRITNLCNLLLDNINMLRETTDAVRAGDAARMNEMMRGLYDQFDPDHPRDPLLAALAETLTEEEHEQITALLDEYWSAWIDWELRNAADKSDAAKRRRQEQLAFGLFQEELRQAYRIAIQPLAQRLERIYEIVEPTDEQRAAIRTIMLDYLRATRLSASQEEQNHATSRIYALLDDTRREKLIGYVLWGQ